MGIIDREIQMYLEGYAGCMGLASEGGYMELGGLCINVGAGRAYL